MTLTFLNHEKPWLTEPDEERSEIHGLPCHIQRQAIGHLCGYVGVPQEHPLAAQPSWEREPSVHGGVTYREEREDGLVWIGFDCAHSHDYVPFGHRDSGTYRDISYVREETRRLAAQLALEAIIDATLAGV